jgi:hypothetical protein
MSLNPKRPDVAQSSAEPPSHGLGDEQQMAGVPRAGVLNEPHFERMAADVLAVNRRYEHCRDLVVAGDTQDDGCARR